MTDFQEKETENNGEAPQEALPTLEQKMRRWREAHEKERIAITDVVCPEGGSGSERALSGVAAHDVVLLSELGGAELALVKQIGLFVEGCHVKHTVTLTKVLLDLSRARTEATTRVTNLLTTVETLAARRRLAVADEAAAKPRLRRVV